MTEAEQKAKVVIIAHLRISIEGCVCGWKDLGKPHYDHLVEELSKAGVLANRTL